jgi:DNA-binding GntR family transcriptional regulator
VSVRLISIRDALMITFSQTVVAMEIPAQIYFSNPSAHLLLRTQVYEYLRKELKVEKLKPGMFISMSQLMQNLGISRTPLRDALLQLQTEGFVTFLPQRGIRINKLTQQEIEYMYEMLGALDSRILLAVFDKLGSAEIEQMKKINQEMYTKMSEDQFYQYWDLNTAFHHVYLDLSSNAPILHQLNIIRQRLFEFGKKDWGTKIRENNYNEHLTMIKLIEKEEAVQAADFMRDVHCIINY